MFNLKITIVLVLFSLFAGVINSNAQSSYYTGFEGFNYPNAILEDSLWTMVNTGNLQGHWAPMDNSIVSNLCHTGAKCAAVGLIANQDCWLFTKQINAVPGFTYTFKFYFRTWNNFGGPAQFKIAAGNGNAPQYQTILYTSSSFLNDVYDSVSVDYTPSTTFFFFSIESIIGSQNTLFVIDDLTYTTSQTRGPDAGISAWLSPNPSLPQIPFSPINYQMTVKNFGTDTLQPGVPVSLSFKSGNNTPTVYGPVNTTTLLIPGATENITFTNISVAAGTYTVKAYTQLIYDVNRTNDTITNTILYQNSIGSSYYTNFRNLTGWTVTSNGTTNWISAFNSTLINPDGITGDTVAELNFFNWNQVGKQAYLISPSFDLTTMLNPCLRFYVAYSGYYDGFLTTKSDKLEIVVSTDNGVTWSSALYNKTLTSSPSLATVSPRVTNYIPTAANQWRHETVNLSAYSTFNNVKIGLRGTSAFGNNLWIDNFSLVPLNNILTQSVTGAGTYTFSSAGAFNFKVIFNTAGVSGQNLIFGSNSSLAPYNGYGSQFVTTPGGITTPDGSNFTPDHISPDKFFTVTYGGVDYNHAINYNIQIDVTNFVGIADPTKLYILTRADEYAPWTALNTTYSAPFLIATGFTKFSQFTLGANSNNPLPVLLSEFTARTNSDNVNLNWITSKEINNAGFTLQRTPAGNSDYHWVDSKYINGHGNTNTPVTYSYKDAGLATGKFKYRLKQTDYNGNSEYYMLSDPSIVEIGKPERFGVSQNYPNPSNPKSKIDFQIPIDGKVSIKVYDLIGREVAVLMNEAKEAGYYTSEFDGTNLASGVYLYRIIVENGTQNFSKTMKMILVK